MPKKTVKFLVDFALLPLTCYSLRFTVPRPLPNATRKFLPSFHVSRATFHANVIHKLHIFRAVSALFSKEVFTTPCAPTTCDLEPQNGAIPLTT